MIDRPLSEDERKEVLLVRLLTVLEQARRAMA